MAQTTPPGGLDTISDLVNNYKRRIYESIGLMEAPQKNIPSFARLEPIESPKWTKENFEKFLQDTPNKKVFELQYLSEMGYITALEYSPDGSHVVVGHSTGLIQVRHGMTGRVVWTARSIQFPPHPVYAIHYSRTEEGACYCASTDGNVYRIDIPMIFIQSDGDNNSATTATYGVDKELDQLQVSYFGANIEDAMRHVFAACRSPALCLGVTADNVKMAVGYADYAIKIFDMETQETLVTYKIHKSRLDLLPKKLQRVHRGRVCALECHPEKHNIMATGSWDRTLRIWDLRCELGCTMTFEGVNIIGNSIDLNRDICVAGSWQPLEALTTWDLRAHKRLAIVKAQNRRADVDGEYIYACKFWKSPDYNRKGKYAIIGGSGTSCLEILNLHNRYISCSFPARGTILALASHEERIVYGGTPPMFCMAVFHEPKHELETYEPEEKIVTIKQPHDETQECGHHD